MVVGGLVGKAIFMSNPTTVLRLCCVVVGVVTKRIGNLHHLGGGGQILPTNWYTGNERPLDSNRVKPALLLSLRSNNDRFKRNLSFPKKKRMIVRHPTRFYMGLRNDSDILLKGFQ